MYLMPNSKIPLKTVTEPIKAKTIDAYDASDGTEEFLIKE
jgi:hypothetical protein